MFASTLSSFWFCSILLAFSTLSNAQGSIKNDKVAKQVQQLAIKGPNKTYYIKNHNGHWLHYKKNTPHIGYDLYPASGTSGRAKLLLKPNPGTTQTRISDASDGGHCASAQWDDQHGGFDGAMVLYACVVLPNKSSTLEKPKQFWYFVPQSKLKRSLSGRAWSKRMRDRVEEHEDYERFSYDEEVVDEETGAITIAKRTSSGPYYIIPYDHIYDMKTRALTGSEINTSGGEKSTRLDVWNQKSTAQLWYLYEV